jgi:DNA-binding MarR family transcriptional regulator
MTKERTFTTDELQALARLYEARHGLFGDENTPVSLSLLATFMEKDEAEAEQVMAKLEAEGLVRKLIHARREFYFLTDEGATDYEYASADQ